MQVASSLMKVTRPGSLTGWSERICQLVCGVMPWMDRYVSDGSPQIVSLKLVSEAHQADRGGPRYEALVAEIARLEALMEQAQTSETIRIACTIRYIGARVIDGNSVYTIVVGHVRKPGESRGPLLRGEGGDALVLTAPGALSALLPLAAAGDELELDYVKTEGEVNGEIRKITVQLEDGPR